jgi:hypothetical protein
MHWTEYLFAIFLVIAVLLMIVGPDMLSAGIYGILISVVSGLGLLFVWGIAKYKSLADAAERLEQLAEANHKEVSAYTKINDGWDEGIKESGMNLDRMTASLGLISNDAEEIQKFEQQLGNLVAAKKRCLAEEKACFEVEVRHQKITRANAVEQRRGNMKEALKRAYDRIDRRDKFGGKHDGVLSGGEIKEFRKAMEADKFLNMVTEDEKKTRMFNWEDKFDEIAADGEINKWELLDALDVVTDSYFLEVRDAKKHTEVLEKKLKELKARVE